MLRTKALNQMYNQLKRRFVVLAIIFMVCIYVLYSLKFFLKIPLETKHYEPSKDLTEILESNETPNLNRESHRWPPHDVNVLKDLRTGYYDMRIRPKVKVNGTKMDTIQAYVQSLKDPYGSLFYICVHANGGVVLFTRNPLRKLDYTDI